jgi:hypothetical protein
MVEYFVGSPLAKNGINPQRRSSSLRLFSTWQMTGTFCVGATL